MWIRRIAVRNFRKLLHGAEIDELKPGLTVIVGDNEEGKSTLLKALQSAFFDRYKLTGDAANDMKPFGSEVRPEVEVDFDVGQTSYRLKKGFLQSSSALLESNGDRWQNDSAEDQLRDVLGFSSPDRGAAKEKHRGLSGLLWVEQGKAFAPLQLNQDTRNALHEAIEGEVGQVTGGERGRKLLATVTRNYDTYYTPTGREKKELKDTRGEVESLKTQVESLESDLVLYDDKVDTLANLKNILARYESEGRLAQAQAEMQKAQDAVRKLEAVEEKIANAETSLNDAQTARTLAQDALNNRRDEAKSLQEVEREAEHATKEIENLDAERHLATEVPDGAAEHLKVARSAFEDAKSERIAAQRERRRSELAAELERLLRRLGRARKIEGEIEQKRQAATQIRIEQTELNALKKKESNLEKQRAALEAVATTIRFFPSGSQSVTVDGQKWKVEDQHRITERTTLALKGFGKLEITPGGEDVQILRSAVSSSRNSLEADLKRIGYDSVDSAYTACRERDSMLADIKNAQSRLDEIASQGLEQLRAEANRLQEELVSTTDDGSKSPASVEIAKEREQAALSQEKEADRTQVKAQKALEAERENVATARERWVEAKSALTQRQKEIGRLQIQLARDRRKKSDADLNKDVEAATRMYDTRTAALHELQTQREGMSPDSIWAEQQRSQDVYQNLQKQITKDKEQADKLEGELRGIGQKGLGEAAQQKRGELEAATQNLARLELDANAWKLLRDTLQQAEHKAKEIFLAPVTERLQPYMNLVFPGTKLQLDDEGMEIAALHRTHDEPFASLSIGTREQIAVLARLALADLLREKGKPVVLILDDALVNCDDERFKRMAHALRKAAENVQIIILTCHEARYQELGVPPVRLMDCKGAAA